MDVQAHRIAQLERAIQHIEGVVATSSRETNEQLRELTAHPSSTPTAPSP